MSEFLWQAFHRLIAETDFENHRFLYDKLNLKHHLIGITGPRGVGKTTMLLQIIKEKYYQKNDAFYFSADNTYFNETSLLTFIDELYQKKAIRTVFIDEIHKYPRWNQELKNLHDAFPNLKIVFSGSSSIDLIKGTYDLSRRAKLYHLPGLSFREYLNIKTNNDFPSITLEELLTNHQKISARLSKLSTLLMYFDEYLSLGYYPIVFKNRDNIYDAISNIIDKTIYEDVANFYNLKTANLLYLKRILNFLASSQPGEIKTNTLARHLHIDNKTVQHYIEILQQTGLIKLLYPVAQGNQLLVKPNKMYLDNTTLLTTINTLLSGLLVLGTQRELVFLQFIKGAGINVFYPYIGDFQINDIIFEIGGKSKKWQQLENHKGEKYLVKDNILVGFGNEIPLYLFGFLY